MWIVLAYLLLINLLALALYGIDKRKARKDAWRIPEKWLIGIAFLGGGIGAWCGMRLFRHKTKHWYFVVLVPLAVVIWLAAIVAGVVYRDVLLNILSYL